MPAGKTTIGYKWFYINKYDPQIYCSRYKARLFILGNRQRYGIDYDQIFAHVPKLTTVRFLLVVAAIKGWFTHQMDVKNSFLHDELKKVAYMKFPPGYEGQDFNSTLYYKRSTQTCQSFRIKCAGCLRLFMFSNNLQDCGLAN